MLSPSLSTSYLLLGTGEGEKVARLKAEAPMLERLGVKFVPSACIGMDRTAPIVEALAAASGELLLDDARLVPLRATLAHAYNWLGRPRYLAVRSSAEGDAAGTGVYASQLIRVDSEEEIVFAAIKVCTSHNTREARSFREELNLKDGIALLLQPVAGDTVQCARTGGSYFAPALNFILNTASDIPIYLTNGLGDPASFDAAVNKSDVYIRYDNLRQLDFEGTVRRGISPLGWALPVVEGSANVLRECHFSVDGARLLLPGSSVAERLSSLVLYYGRTPNRNVYMEGAISRSGEVFITQFSATTRSDVKLPDNVTLQTKWRQVENPVGAVSLDDADLIVVNPERVLSTDDLYNLMERSPGVRRSCVLMIPQSALQAFFHEPRQVWGALKNVGAVICVDDKVRARPIESHFNGSIRAADNFGFCVVQSDFRVSRQLVPMYSYEKYGGISLFTRALNVRIVEGRGAWLSGRAIEPVPAVDDLDPQPTDGEFAFLASQLGGAEYVKNSRRLAAEYAEASRYREFYGFSTELRRLANALQRFGPDASAEDPYVSAFVENHLGPRGVTPREFAADLFTVHYAIITRRSHGNGSPYCSIADDALARDGLDGVLASLERVCAYGFSLPVESSDCIDFVATLKANLRKERPLALTE